MFDLFNAAVTMKLALKMCKIPHQLLVFHQYILIRAIYINENAISQKV